ncbi:MAG: hypothetical protein ACM36C_02470, partial [Acidobacteriota bacterium]
MRRALTLTRLVILLAGALVITSFVVQRASAAPADRAAAGLQAAAVDLTGRWQLNTELSDQPPQPPEGGRPGGGREGEGGGHHGGHPGGGGYPGGGTGGMGGGMPGGGGMHGGPGGPGGRPNPEEMAKMRDAMRSALEAPSEIVVTQKEDEVVFTATGSGDITRVLVTGKKMKSVAGGAEHDVKADYKDGALVVESGFGQVKVLDTWRVSTD